MQRRSLFTLCICATVGIFCLRVLHLGNGAIFQMHTAPVHAELSQEDTFLEQLKAPVGIEHSHENTPLDQQKAPVVQELSNREIVFEQRNSDRKPTEVKKGKAGNTDGRKEQKQEESDTEDKATPLNYSMIQDHKNFSNKQSTSSSTNTMVVPVPSTQFKTPRPQVCSGCFQTNFPVLTDQPDLCKIQENGRIDIVFLITTKHQHTARRHAIRKTWASVTRNNTSNLRHVFVLGMPEHQIFERVVMDEARSYRDVVVLGFHDSYKNLTLKVISSLRWLTSRCQQAKFFMKTDDDVFINTAVVMAHVKKLSQFLQHGMAGTCYINYVERNVQSKWYVPKHLYPEDTYPPYCRGEGYISSMAVAEKILHISVDVPYLPIEDAYVGMCLKRLGYGVRNFVELQLPFNNSFCPAYYQTLPTVHPSLPDRMFRLWKLICR